MDAIVESDSDCRKPIRLLRAEANPDDWFRESEKHAEDVADAGPLHANLSARPAIWDEREDDGPLTSGACCGKACEPHQRDASIGKCRPRGVSALRS